MSETNKIRFIPREMRMAHELSFPLSPGTMEGHNLTALLYWYYRQDLLAQSTVVEVFGTEFPKPPDVRIPEGHDAIPKPHGLNNTVWNTFLDTSFKSRPQVDHLESVRKLITVNAESDVEYFDDRLAKKRSKVVSGGPTPSLLRAFAFEHGPAIPNQFFVWLCSMMAQEMITATENDFKESWTSELQTLIYVWNSHFPKTSFLPEKK